MSCHIGDLETHIGFLEDHTREVFEGLEAYRFDRDQVIEVWGDLRLLKIRDWKWHFLVNFLEMESIGTLGKNGCHWNWYTCIEERPMIILWKTLLIMILEEKIVGKLLLDSQHIILSAWHNEMRRKNREFQFFLKKMSKSSLILYTSCYSSLHVVIPTTIPNEEIWEKQKKIHRFNVVRQMPTSTGTGKKAFIISKLGLHKRVFILTLKYWNSKNTLELRFPSGMERNKGICPFSSICVFHSIWATYYNNLHLSEYSPP